MSFLSQKSNQDFQGRIGSLLGVVPLACFLAGYLLHRDLLPATLWLMVGTIIQALLEITLFRKLRQATIWGGLLILVLGGTTLALNDSMFLKLKPTFVMWALGLTAIWAAYRGKRVVVSKPCWHRSVVAPTSKQSRHVVFGVLALLCWD